MTTPVYRVALRMTILPGREKEWEEAWLAGAARIAGNPGNVGQELCRGDADGAYHVVSDWTSEEAFLAYEGSPDHQEHLKVIAPFRTAGQMMTMHTVYRLDATGRTR